MTTCSGQRAVAGFQLDSTPLLSRPTADLAEPRWDTLDQTALWGNGLVVRVDARGRTPLAADDRLVCVPAKEYGSQPVAGAVLLAVRGETSYWALRTEPDEEQDTWRDLRSAGGLLDDTDASLLTTAVGLLGWHDKARYCAVCGATTRRVQAGRARRCTGCDREEYPRTDPSMICLVHDGGDLVLLARQTKWPPERYSVLAGFVEVGESLEGCVRREVAEEVGLGVSDVRYLGSQPWPFPRSLMLGFAAIADPAAELRLAEDEIAEARWMHRDHIREALEADGPVRGLRLPPGVSIAYRMLRGWAYWND